MQSLLKTVFIVFLTLILAACGSTNNGEKTKRTNPKDLDANIENGSPLKIRNKKKRIGQLYRPSQLKQLEIPPSLVSTTTDSVLNNLRLDESLQNVLPEPITAKIVKDENKRWLKIDASVESAWEAIIQFWALGGIELIELNPQTGIMETDWVTQVTPAIESRNTIKQVASNVFTSFIRRNTTLNKYRIRFERVDANTSLMFVMVRSIEKKSIKRAKKLSEFSWVEADSDQEKTNDFLQSIILIFDQES